MEPDTPIYRVFSFRRFCEQLQANQLSLRWPEKWDDPFENFILKGNAVLPEGLPIMLKHLRRSLYGQCWTLHEESDAMWRIYTQTKGDGVKVRTTARKLIRAFPSERALSVYLGRVKYRSDGEIEQIMKSQFGDFMDNGVGEGLAKTLLIKRVEFEHEQEVRLIYTDVNDRDLLQDTYSFPVNPNELYEEIVLDPRLDDPYVEKSIQVIEKLGYSGPIRKSSLYRIPDFDPILWSGL